MNINIPILIPAYNPDEALWRVVDGLIGLGFKDLIIVDDGSIPGCEPIFARLAQMKECHFLRHAINLGKGRALKTGLNYFYLHFPHSPGLVTADADGQHQPADILKVAAALTENPAKLVIGARQMSGKVPFRSLFGNVLTRFVFSSLVGKKIADTQSGLRGIPRAFIPHILALKGERYEYEINMLISTKIQGVKIIEMPIDTIYIEDNKASHFNPLVDSMRIYFLLFRFLFSSFFSAVIDLIVFITVYRLSASILAGITAARSVSGTVNFFINKKVVFKAKSNLYLTLLKYVLVLVIRGGLSYMLIYNGSYYLHIDVTGAYIVVESSLFIINFAIQRDFVFYSEANEREI
jgi:putative flippase GtrA